MTKIVFYDASTFYDYILILHFPLKPFRKFDVEYTLIVKMPLSDLPSEILQNRLGTKGMISTEFLVKVQDPGSSMFSLIVLK